MIPFDASGAFHLGKGGHELRRLAVRGAAATVSASAAALVAQVISTLILARMLTPADFGLVTMVTTFSLLLSSFGLAGFTEAVLQTEKITHLLASNLFWINIAGGLTLSVAFGAAGSLLARFYADPRITHVSIGYSLAVFFSIAPVLHLSLLKRAMMFGAVSVNDIVGRVASMLTAVCCAYLGWGYWALVAGTVVQP